MNLRDPGDEVAAKRDLISGRLPSLMAARSSGVGSAGDAILVRNGVFLSWDMRSVYKSHQK